MTEEYFEDQSESFEQESFEPESFHYVEEYEDPVVPPSPSPSPAPVAPAPVTPDAK